MLFAVVQGDLIVPTSGVVWSALVVTAFIASALGFFVQTYAQRHAPPARTALILASERALAGLFTYLLKGETLGVLDWTGAVLILGAIVAVEAVPGAYHSPIARGLTRLLSKFSIRAREPEDPNHSRLSGPVARTLKRLNDAQRVAGLGHISFCTYSCCPPPCR